MGCTASACCNKNGRGENRLDDEAYHVEVGSPRARPIMTDKQLWHEREQESGLSCCVAESLPPTLLTKLSKQSSQLSSIGPRNSLGKFENRGYSMGSYDSQSDFADPSQTIIIFDWDDTLCPSSSMKPFAEFDRQGKLRRKLPSDVRNELKLLTDVVVPLLKMAKTMGHVIMVTNARAPWVDISCQNFLPAVKEHLADIPVTYALELVDMDNPKDFDESTGCLLTETKARAMKAAVSQFYSRYPGQSWKNIVSIGDAYFEHDAIRQVVGNKDQAKKCRTKTIKLLEGPTTAGMVVQLSILKGWLQQIVQTDTDIDIDLMDEENVSKWVDLYGTPQD
eukprot:CAMPEP_0206488472 /NCGR_PEP_ID=MMETSP0324_2-20121206/42440_1 /ASSEMBLY_ACC=CAM_ASM_000836 /TAXON_ID=2866 /ORGANISM="Crypthecodinium cohnii, Strain Seligo" /LENGTH=335 /DNA_ID=CAMNT_0053967517 /DNA_START=69 /DNA_END=1076 /DNA_ORIENTATION=+